jgi:hypothetical protein
MMTKEEMIMYDQFVDMGIATSEELNFARDLVPGSWSNVLNQVLYVKTGYRSLDQMIEEE